MVSDFSPQDLGIPFDRWRPHQAETIIDVVASDKRVVLLEAPTGSGKSAIAYGIHKLGASRKSVIVCHTKQLQEQYLSMPGVVSVKGRGNFDCLIQPGTADEAPCILAGPRHCEEYAACPYYTQLHKALISPISCHNYSYWLKATQGGLFTPLDLLVCDEAHLLEQQLRSEVAVDLFRPTLKRADIDLPDFDQDWGRWKRWAVSVARDLEGEATAQYNFHELGAEEVKRAKAVKTVYERCSVLADLDEDWIIQRGDQLGRGDNPFAKPLKYVFRPVWVSKFGHERIFQHASKIVLMSATILSPEHFCQGLGVDPAEVEYLKVPSTFPAERRPVYLQPVVKVRHGMTDQERRLLVAAVDDVLDRHPDEKGLVHTANYQIAREIAQWTKHKNRIVTHQTQDRMQKLEYFKSSSEPLVLVSPSMTTGVDLPDQLCEFQVIVKLPYPNLGDEQVKRRMKLGPDGNPNPNGQAWYLWETACALVQSTGRGMRSATDSVSTYILDENMTLFKKRVWGILPEWWRAALVERPNVDFIVKQLRES